MEDTCPARASNELRMKQKIRHLQLKPGCIDLVHQQ